MQPNKAEQFQKTIEASSDEAIIGLLTELRETGEDYMLPTILSLLFSTRSEKLKNEVVNFLVDLKNKSSIDTIVEAIRQNKRSKDIHLLVSVCWQSRLDFTPYVDTFIDIMEHGNYQACLEAFTVIENMTENLSGEQLNDLKAKIKSVKGDNAETKPLIEELVKLLDEL
ncbi:MAG: hypothetical protein WBJ36_11580 [Tenuifilum sp.]|uniref:hypothetical protein n=1 Tax=Tenuifilum sp. TaxID=2760880 RepID=UPI001B54EAC6|nr:hypothetical protein [Bacteroidales bacterium]HOK60272.1 hypothetical protein [Tenuifilum sp.]MBP9030321.1 hypothetical protein [Bacteroidales bacterium]HOK85280.1 hypothetical protein [Tenuifilum sp.]HON70062.1 hypothetical protein [Tenuifilum sp.]